MSPDAAPDVAIVGAGIVGLSCALEMLERGRTVVLIDPGIEKRRSSYGNAGVLGRNSILPVASPSIWKNLPRYMGGGDPAVRIDYRSLPYFAPWLRGFLARANERDWRRSAALLDRLVARALDRHMALGALAGTLPLIRLDGWLRLYRSAESFAASRLEREILAEHGVAAVPLSAGEIHEMEPGLAPRFSHGLHFAQAGSVDSPGELVRRYETAVRGRGGVFIEATAQGLRQDDTGVTIRTGRGAIRAAHAVISAGVWSKELVRDLGWRVPLAAERGYHVHYRLKPGSALRRPVHDTGGSYVISPMGETVRILTGIELARPDAPAHHGQIEAVTADAARTIALAEPAGDTWLGNRPSTPDGLPVIGFAPRQDRIVLAFGHGHIGFSTGPVTGQIVARLLCKEPQELDLDDFSLQRFGAR